ncbi:membrane dipeptidase [Nocardia mangyaensis]|uniref:Membrane dipeptidase n=1 Tax=Nocardia mangyaensis TaxID=2213200 RepID=A0A1J0VZY6_9NOCA|nr:membrane dipeptidase [Nocardia mangyaensis]APE37495.1 membrane dipeptidase [Nocardia mangyaensis]
MPPRLWEQHCCLPLRQTARIAELARYPLGSYLSVNVGYSAQNTADSLALLHQFRDEAAVDPRFRLVESLADVGRDDVIALAFDLEDSAPLGGDLDTVELFHRLGVRSLLPTYNHANAAGCGCLDAHDTGLTGYGKDLVRKLNEVGVFADGSHCSRRTGLDIATHTAVPMIYSHSNFAALWEHPRNITDDQARACAATGGVIGINGVGIFLGHNDPDDHQGRLTAMADHLRYGVDLVGIDHIGIGSDYSFDGEEFNDEIRDNPAAFSDSYTRWGPLQWVSPEELLGARGLDDLLATRGFTPGERAALFHGNFARVAQQVWRTPERAR